MSVARSYLFVPGNRPDRFDRALAAGADRVIIDLEDAVAPADKIAARQALADWLAPERSVIVRINGADTEWYAEDLALCRRPGVEAVLLPKAEFIGDELAALCRSTGCRILPLIETARGFQLAEVLATSENVQRLVFGTIDFQVDLGLDGEGDELLFFRSQLVLVSRLACIEPPVDGVSTEIQDLDRVRTDADRARRLGFGAKLCIHPKQVPAVHDAWRPSDAEFQWAQRVLAAFQAANGGAVAVDGRMVDRPVMLKAEQIVRERQR
ncbi:MAG: CoA ester lyase [Burkholderiales bacterium]|nr:CoA ester lyase [Burkholderiales bacterium]